MSRRQADRCSTGVVDALSYARSTGFEAEGFEESIVEACEASGYELMEVPKLPFEARARWVVGALEDFA
jgi:predicted ATPase